MISRIWSPIFLKNLVGTGANAIALQIAHDDNNAIITFTGTGCTASDAMKPGGGFLGRLCDRTGGTLSCSVDGKIRKYAISIGALI